MKSKFLLPPKSLHNFPLVHRETVGKQVGKGCAELQDRGMVGAWGREANAAPIG